MSLTNHLDLADPSYREAAQWMLTLYERHDWHESNIRSAISEFLRAVHLVDHDESELEGAPVEGSPKQVDIVIDRSHVHIEAKKRIGTARNRDAVDVKHLDQLDNYLAERGGPYVGVLSDGKRWVLRTCRDPQGQVRPAPYRFNLDTADDWYGLYEWLRDYVFVNKFTRRCSLSNLELGFGPGSPAYDNHIAMIARLYKENRETPTVTVKRTLWATLLGVALGELDGLDMDELFVRHTYLVTTVGIITHAAVGIDITALAATSPSDLIRGEAFRKGTGLVDIVESDFFSWLVEVAGYEDVVRSIADHVAAYAWEDGPPAGLESALYQTVISKEERDKLGEHYTPDWLATKIVEEAVTDPLRQRVLDPACGSGAFLTASIRHLIAAAAADGLSPADTLRKLQNQVTGVDIHPVAVHLARAAWVSAARDVINSADHDHFSVPVHLGDSLQLLYDTESMFNHEEIIVPIADDTANRDLRFPRTLVDRAEVFGSLMSAVASATHDGRDPQLALSEYGLSDAERGTMTRTVQTLSELHEEGRNHIWAYYTRNLVRPIAISTSKVDVIVGNPPWLTYNQTVPTLRKKLRYLSEEHGIWAGGNVAAQHDIAGLFFLRTTHLYLDADHGPADGVCAMVLPHSVLTGTHYAKWRSGAWSSDKPQGAAAADLSWRPPWNLEPLNPNTFFPVPACVVFAQRSTHTTPLPREITEWHGPPGLDASTRPVTLPSPTTGSPYKKAARNGATIFPRCLFFVEDAPRPPTIRPPRTRYTNPRRGRKDKGIWAEIALATLEGFTIDESQVFGVHLGETVAPYVTLPPLRAVLPISDGAPPAQADTLINIEGGEHTRTTLNPQQLPERAADRWAHMSALWQKHKSPSSKLNLLQQLNYHGKLSKQLAWQAESSDKPIRVVYTKSGRPTAAILNAPDALIENALYWISCSGWDEAHYLSAIVNSDVLLDAVKPLMPHGQYGPRDLHKHLWKLPIPTYDPDDPVHKEIRDAGIAAAALSASIYEGLTNGGRRPGVAATRRAIRVGLREAPEGASIERTVRALLP